MCKGEQSFILDSQTDVRPSCLHSPKLIIVKHETAPATGHPVSRPSQTRHTDGSIAATDRKQTKAWKQKQKAKAWAAWEAYSIKCTYNREHTDITSSTILRQEDKEKRDRQKELTKGYACRQPLINGSGDDNYRQRCCWGGWATAQHFGKTLLGHDSSPSSWDPTKHRGLESSVTPAQGLPSQQHPPVLD